MNKKMNKENNTGKFIGRQKGRVKEAIVTEH